MTLTRNEDLLDRLVAEYADRLSRGEDPGREQVLERHPELRDELARCFRMLEAGRPAAGPAVAARLGEFVIEDELGRGGMAVVYRALQPSLRRKVALKVLRQHLTLEPRHLDRFRREAQAAARLRHPNVVPVHAVGEEDGHHFIAMELIEGPTLAGVLACLAALGRRPTPADIAEESGAAELARCASYPEAAVRLLLPALEGLAAAHEAGLVHRDVKPGNILLARDGRPLVSDFGLAKSEGDLALSLTGEPIGTPYYMSPEQAEAAGHGVDLRTDLYSAGVVLFELLTLKRPFDGRSAHEVLGRIVRDAPPWPRGLAPDVPRDLEAVVVRAMAKRPEERYAGMAQLIADLRAVLAGEPITAPTHSSLRQALAALGAVFVGRGRVAEFRSARTLCGWPLVHIAAGWDPVTHRPRVARGVIAIGNVAIGGFALGGLAFGGIALGGGAVGLLAFGGAAVGGLVFGGVAIGLVAIGGFAVGVVAVGGKAIGWLYALGGSASGPYVIDHARRDPEALDFFGRWMPWLLDRLHIPR